MALAETGIDFSGEDWNQPAQVFDGCWVIATRHSPGMIKAMELNNRTFVFRVKSKSKGTDVLLAFGPGSQDAIDAVKSVSANTGLPVDCVVGNGGAHHLFLDLWYQAFPDARVLIPAKRVPLTRNGKALKDKYAARWELLEGSKPSNFIEEYGDTLDMVIFDQLFGYTDEHSAEVMNSVADHTSEPPKVKGFGLMMKFGKLMGNVASPNDEVFMLHKPSGLVIAGHNFQFIYKPKGYKPQPSHKMSMGGFPMGLMMNMMMPKGSFKSSLEGQAAPVADSAIHATAWESVLDWDINAWTSCHDPPQISGPDMTGEEIKKAIRESIARSGEDDPTGARLKWNKKNKKKS